MQLLTVAAVLAATNSICQSMEMSTIAPDFRSDPMRTLISVSAPWSQIVSTQQGTGAASPLLKDDTEAIYENSTTIWATISHQEQLRNAGFSLGPAADLGLRSFRLEKQRRYMDIRGEEPMWNEFCGYDCLTNRIAEMAADGGCAYPIELKSIGRTVRGRDIWAFRIGSQGPDVLMAANIHGDEVTGGQLLQRWMWETCNKPSSEQSKVATSVTAWYVPMLNADGYEANTRANGNGRDLNRCFPTPSGGVGDPQPETEAYMNFHKEHKFVISTMFHGGAVVCNYPYDSCYTSSIVPRPCPPASTQYHRLHNDVIPSAKAYCDPLQAKGVRCTVGTDCLVNGAAWYVIEGSLQDWAFHFGETLDMTMEISAVKRPAASTLPGFYDNNYNAIANFMLWPLSTLPSNTTSV